MRKIVVNLQGFTLLELLVGLAIVGILASVGVPTYRNLIINARNTSASSQLHAALLYARSEAVKRSATVVICHSVNADTNFPSCSGSSQQGGGSDWGEGWLVFVDKNKDTKFSSGDVLLRVQTKLFSSVKQGTIIPTPNRIQLSFNATGQTFGTFMHFSVHGPEGESDHFHDRFICIAMGGRARVDALGCRTEKG
jgi:type IV fimbrial biogenesis protein FimT